MTTPVQQQVIDVLTEEINAVKARLESLPITNETAKYRRDEAVGDLDDLLNYAVAAILATVDQPFDPAPEPVEDNTSVTLEDLANAEGRSSFTVENTAKDTVAEVVEHVAKKPAPAKRSRKRA